MTLLLMYDMWEDNGNKKRRLEEHLRAKKLEREGFSSPPPPVEVDKAPDLDKAIIALNQQRDVAQVQNQQIEALTGMLEQQRGAMEDLLKQQQNQQPYQVVYRPPDGIEKKTDPNMPMLDESSVPYIDSSHIDSITGKAGEVQSVEGDTQSKAEKLKKMLKKKKE